MNKPAQLDDDQSSLFYNPIGSAKTLEDLFNAVRGDIGLSAGEREKLLAQIQGLVGFIPGSTPLSALMMKGLGGMLGWYISKYFGLTPVGRLVSTVAGFGLGSVLYDQLNKPPDPYPGFKLWGQ